MFVFLNFATITTVVALICSTFWKSNDPVDLNVLLYFQFFKSSGSSVNVFLGSLATADLLLIIVCLPLKVSPKNGNHHSKSSAGIGFIWVKIGSNRAVY